MRTDVPNDTPAPLTPPSRPDLGEDWNRVFGEHITSRKRGRILIVGGGRVGRGLAAKFPGAIILESDPSKVESLREGFPEHTALAGSGTDKDVLRHALGTGDVEVLVAATHTDETNYKVALLAVELGIKRIVSRVEDPDTEAKLKGIGVETVAAPIAASINMIANLLQPERRRIGEGVIGEKSPSVGRRIDDLALPDGGVVCWILRGEHLISPSPGEKLEVGDVVTVMTDEENLPEVLIAVTGRDISINPLNRLYVPLLDRDHLRGAFQEAFILADYADAELYVVAPEATKDLLVEAERIAKLNGMDIRTEVLPGRFAQGFVEAVRREDALEEHGGLDEGFLFECIVLNPTDRGWLDGIKRKGLLERSVAQLAHPVIVARRRKPYKSILLVIDNTANTPKKVGYTIDLALLYGSDVTALLVADPAGEETQERHLKWLKRAGKLYGVQVRELEVEGNPTLEFIQEVKSGSHDLVVVDWRSRSIKRDIVRRVIRHGPHSVLIMP